jgi:hypothetical protein
MSACSHVCSKSDPQFITYINDKLVLLQQVTSQCRASFNVVNEAYATTSRYLGESASSYPPDALFKQLASFLSDIVRSVASLREKAHRLRLRTVKSRTVAASPRGSRRRSSLLVAVVAEAQAKNRRSIRLSPIESIDTDAVALEEPPTSARRRLSLRRVSVAKVSTPTSARPTSLRRAADALPILPE